MKEEKKKKRKQPLVSDEPMDVDMSLLSPSFKEEKQDNRDEFIASFDMDKTIPIDKRDVCDVLESETKKFQQLSTENKEIVKKEIELELLYNYDKNSQNPKEKQKESPKASLIAFLLILSLILIIVLMI